MIQVRQRGPVSPGDYLSYPDTPPQAPATMMDITYPMLVQVGGGGAGERGRGKTGEEDEGCKLLHREVNKLQACSVQVRGQSRYSLTTINGPLKALSHFVYLKHIILYISYTSNIGINIYI